MLGVRHDPIPEWPALWPESGVEDVAERIWSTHDACRKLGIDRTTLKRWARKAGITEVADPVDKRISGWTDRDLAALARAHQRQLLRLPDPDEARGIRDLRREVAELRALLEAHLASHQRAHGGIRAPERQEPPPTAEGEHKPIPARQKRTTVRLVQSRGDTLPPGWVAVARFAEDHKQPLRTVKRHIAQGLLPAPHEGPFKRGRISGIMHVWDEEQQQAAKRHWQERGRIPADT